MDETSWISTYLVEGTSDGVMLDVGAHHGGTAHPFLTAGWTVYAFEPDALNRKRLLSLCERYPRLHVDPRAVADRVQAAVPFYTSPVSDGISGLSRFHATHTETGRVDTATLGDFCAERGIGDVRLLKVDTEGYDLLVLRGLDWARTKPEVILCEFEDRKTVPLGYTFHDLARFLAAKQYELLISEWFPIEEYGRQHRWRRFTTYPCELADSDAWGNILAFRDGVDWGRLMTAVAQAREDGGQRTEDGGRMAAELRDLREQVRYMSGSWSWRVTGPMRAAFKAVKARRTEDGDRRSES